MIDSIRFFVPVFLGFLYLSGCSEKVSPQFFELASAKSFEDVIQDTEFAITEHNFRITNRLHIGEAIRARGNSDFPRNKVILFCNLTLAEAMLQKDPRYIYYCPYKIAIAETRDGIMVGTRLLPTNSGNPKLSKSTREINQTLIRMVKYAAVDDPFIFEETQDTEQ